VAQDQLDFAGLQYVASAGQIEIAGFLQVLHTHQAQRPASTREANPLIPEEADAVLRVRSRDPSLEALPVIVITENSEHAVLSA
jgi:hypothetical protein